MHSLRIDLQEGFSNDTVVVRVNGKESYRKSGVNTRLPVGVAESFEVQVDDDAARVEIRLENKGLSGILDLRPSEHPYVAISVTHEGQVTFQPSKELFRYM